MQIPVTVSQVQYPLLILWGSHQCFTEGSEERLTFGHGAGVDKRGQAAALGFGGVVAGMDLDLVAGEVLQAGDDG